MAVVLFHYDSDKSLFPVWASSFGYSAVSFFFVLSGFILTYAHWDNRVKHGLNVAAGEFYTARIGRIAPVYAFSLLLSAPFFVYGYLVSHQMSGPLFLMATALVPLLLQAWVPPIALAWNIPAWSLSVEAFFYLMFPLMLPRLAGLRPLSVLGASIALVGAAAMARSWLRLIGPSGDRNWQYFLDYFPLFHLPQFSLGIAIGLVFLKARKPTGMTADALAAIALAMLCFVVVQAQSHWMLSNSLLLSLVFGSLVYTLAASQGGPVARLLSVAPLVFLGQASYAAYVLHIPILVLWKSAAKRVDILECGPIANFGIYIAILIGMSIATFILLERPAKNWVLRLRFSHVDATRG
ncbi:MAG: acyltransferase [Hyphomicrobiales bacterium]|nr:MAG: acyltransferase [Hyphomicrobiales bacterium]